ncbi:MAG TPA: YdcF family protein, partial [Pyrinomonadaceae bacterium]
RAPPGTDMKLRRRLLKRVLITTLCLALVWPFVAWAAAKFLHVQQPVAAADAIVVLSGPGTYLERNDWAGRLYHERRAPLVVVSNEGLLSGWSASDDRNLYFYELAIRRLEQQGVPAKDLRVVSDIGAGTYQESVRLCDYAAAEKLNRILIVTSAYHSRRALWSIQRACKDKPFQIGMESPPPGWQTPAPASWWLHKSGWRMVAGEYVKMIYYRVAY